jgi:hypothetical protein
MKQYYMKRIKLRNIIIFALVLFAFVNLLSKDCVPTPPNPELIYNGNFELGLRGFRTTYDTGYIKYGKTIRVTSNPNQEYFNFDSCSDPTIPGGKFLIINGNDVFDNIEIIWEQTIGVTPNTYYEFQYKYTNIDIKTDSNNNLPIIQVSFNNDFLDTVTFEKMTCVWKTQKIVWYSKNYTSVTIRFRDLTRAYFGNDAGFDDISFKSLCSVQACAGSDVEICLGDTTQIGEPTFQSAIQGFKPYRYKWTPSTGLSSPYEPTPFAFPTTTTKYYLEVTDSLGCVAFDSVTVFVNYPPIAQITTSKPIPICPCDSVTLFAPQNLEYLWSTGDTTQSITINNPGYYAVLVRNQYGCTDTAGIYVGLRNIKTTVELDTINANIGDIITLPLRINDQENFFQCNYDSFKVELAYNKTILFPLNRTPKSIDASTEMIELEGKASLDLLDNVKFLVTLGNSPYSDIKIKTLEWNCDKIEVTTMDGRVNVQNICNEGGERLLDFSSQFALSNIIPNPIDETATFVVNLIEKGTTSVKIYNLFGEIVQTISNKYMEPGTYKFDIKAKNLSPGLYYLVLETPTSRIAKRFIILK